MRNELSTIRSPGSVLAGILIAASLHASPAEGQSAEPDHSAHHPQGGAWSTPATGTTRPGADTSQDYAPPPADQSAPMSGMMEGMMGGRPPKQLYPSLMDVPSLSPETRARMEQHARARVEVGTAVAAQGRAELEQAVAAGDPKAIEAAAERIRDGTVQLESGAATLRALREGREPKDIALTWFKGQLGLPQAAASQPHAVAAQDGLFGWAWAHIVAVTTLAAFALAMIAMYAARMRRAHALVDRLTSAKPVPRTSAAPPVVPAQPAAAASLGQAAPLGAVAPSASTVAPARTRPWTGKLQVVGIFHETPNVKTFRLRDPGGGPIPFEFLPGQFLTYSAQIEGQLVRRSYTIASSAAQTAYVETTVKREAPGIFSGYMHDKLAVGDLVEVMAPFGSFTFRGAEAESVVLIGGGVGITPLMSVIRYLTDIAWPGEIFLVYGARTTEDFIFRDELEYLQRRHRNLDVAATMARAEGMAWMGPEGPITKDLLAQSVPDITQRRVHLCGPPGMMEAVRKALAELGVPADQVKTEAFGPARGAVPPPGVTMVVPSPEPADGGAPSVPAGVTAAPTIGPATASIQFTRSNVTAPLPPDKTVLEVSEAVGVNIDYACRAGICGVCKVRLLEGAVTMEVQEALTPEDKAANIVLACQAKSTGTLAVEA